MATEADKPPTSIWAELTTLCPVRKSKFRVCYPPPYRLLIPVRYPGRVAVAFEFERLPLERGLIADSVVLYHHSGRML